MSERKRVAAVCYRWSGGGGLEFLLVRTRRCGRWTFPKGGLEAHDATPADRARQEAIEEAGVDGVVEPEPLAAYRHLAWIDDDSFCEQSIDAYLLSVTGPAGIAEPGRDPTWFPIEAAAAALSENQPSTACLGDLRAVLDATRQRIGPQASAE